MTLHAKVYYGSALFTGIIIAQACQIKDTNHRIDRLRDDVIRLEQTVDSTKPVIDHFRTLTEEAYK